MKKTILFLTLLMLTLHSSKAQRSSTKPFSIGIIDSLRSEQLQETRIINVYLPQSYTEATTATYPVIYLLDGSADEDFIHIAGLVQYFNFPWINRFPESIVVGIANTNRKRNFTFPVTNLDFLVPLGFDKKSFPDYGGSAAFISFIEKELQPYIAKHYRVNASKTLIGQSLGGLFAAEVLLKRTHLFDTYIILSPSLWWGNGALLSHTPAVAPSKLKVYIGVGKEGNRMIGDAQKLASTLRNSAPNASVLYDYLPGEDHATIGHQGVYNAFKLLYPTAKKQ